MVSCSFSSQIRMKAAWFLSQACSFWSPKLQSWGIYDITRFGPFLRNNRFKKCELVKHFHATWNKQPADISKNFYKDTAKIRKVSLEASTSWVWKQEKKILFSAPKSQSKQLLAEGTGLLSAATLTSTDNFTALTLAEKLHCPAERRQWWENWAHQEMEIRWWNSHHHHKSHEK